MTTVRDMTGALARPSFHQAFVSAARQSLRTSRFLPLRIGTCGIDTEMFQPFVFTINPCGARDQRVPSPSRARPERVPELRRVRESIVRLLLHPLHRTRERHGIREVGDHQESALAPRRAHVR